jgi:hypothetical protein
LLIYDAPSADGIEWNISSPDPIGSIYDNIIWDCGADGIIISTFDYPNIFNNTIYGCNNGINPQGSGTLPIAQNNICMGNTTDYGTESNFHDNSSNNLSDDATAPGVDSLINQTDTNIFVSVTGGSEDFHLKAGSNAIDAGTTLTLFTTDIDAESRPQGSAWDIGADELVAAPAATGARRRGIMIQ